MDRQKEFYKAAELAEKLRVNIMTIYRYIKAGKLKAYKIGKEFRIDKSEFDLFMDKLKTSGNDGDMIIYDPYNKKIAKDQKNAGTLRTNGSNGNSWIITSSSKKK